MLFLIIKSWGSEGAGTWVLLMLNVVNLQFSWIATMFILTKIRCKKLLMLSMSKIV